MKEQRITAEQLTQKIRGLVREDLVVMVGEVSESSFEITLPGGQQFVVRVEER